jgi:hypothetical protein
MDAGTRISIVAGTVSAIVAGFTFATGIQSPFNYVFVGLTVILFLLAATWHRIPRPHRKSKGPKRLFDISTTIRPHRHHYLRRRFSQGDIIRISIVSTRIVDCYVLDEGNYRKFKKGLEFDWLRKAAHLLKTTFELAIPDDGSYVTVVSNQDLEVTSAEIVVDLVPKV